MVIQVTYDILQDGRVIINKHLGNPPEILVEYTLEQDDNSQVQRGIPQSFPYTPTPAEVTSINQLLAKLRGLIEDAHGL